MDADEGVLAGVPGLVRTVRTPDFAGVTFHEVLAKSALSKVPAASSMPFRWTVNPWRGCTHACFYCYARGSHAWLELDTGVGFDTQLVVKTNVVDVLRAELARPSWRHEQVALGTNTDPYQRAEGRYRFMPGIIEALAGSGTPFSLLTKGTLLRRDLPLLVEAARSVPVGLGVSVAIGDPALHASLEPGTPSPSARLDVVRAITDAGLRCGVMVAPVLPWLTDSTDDLDALLGCIAAAGASGATVLPLHLRPGAREWYLGWVRRERPICWGGTNSCTPEAPTPPGGTATGSPHASRRCSPGTASTAPGYASSRAASRSTAFPWAACPTWSPAPPDPLRLGRPRCSSPRCFDPPPWP